MTWSLKQVLSSNPNEAAGTQLRWALHDSESGRSFLAGYDDLEARSKEGADWLLDLIESATSTVVKLQCRTEKCPDKGGWIQRASEEVRRTVYACDTCKQPMVK